MDSFAEVHYDVGYRAEPGRLSLWLRTRYDDGTLIDIKIDDIKAERVSGSETRELIAQSYVGMGGRIFPKRMDSATTPRLWAARQSAIEAMEEFNHEFILTTVPAVFIVITVAAQQPITSPARMRVPAVTRRRVARSDSPAVMEEGAAARSAPHPTAVVGMNRVQRVVTHFGREVVETGRKITVKGVGSTDVDVVLTGKRFIEVGGPSKGFNLGEFGTQLRTLKSYAEKEGGTAYFYYDVNTPQRVIDLAMKWLGKTNVKPIP